MFITWGHEASSIANDAVASGTLAVDVDMHLYNNILETRAAPVDLYFNWQINLVNPDEINYYTGLKDIWDSVLKFSWTTGRSVCFSLYFRNT